MSECLNIQDNLNNYNLLDINNNTIENLKNPLNFDEIWKNKLIEDIKKELIKSGFISTENGLEHGNTKDEIRKLHYTSTQAMRDKYKKSLLKKELKLLTYISDGTDIDPKYIEPKLKLIDSRSKYWDLFNYIKIHWSIPISSGYGRRLCYIIFDSNNEKVIGIIGLSDPVFSISARDNYIGWCKKKRCENLSKLMDGYVIGAVPPYNRILGGKLVASMLFSNKIRHDFEKKYGGKISLINERKHTGQLIAITTLSALGKSSIYDRLKLPNGQKFISVGYSMGYGEFHFNGSIYKRMKLLVSEKNSKFQKNTDWGKGFRNKREVIGKALSLLGLPKNYCKHGVKREAYIIPLAKNYKDILLYNNAPKYYDMDVDTISEFIKKRWLIPRYYRINKNLEWDKNEYILWNSTDVP